MPPNGSATSSGLDTSRPATLTSEASLTLSPTTSSATSNAISSQASADGRSHSGLQDGQTTDLFGQEVAPASRSLPPARARRPMTNATCGLRGFLSSPSAALQSSLESRLKRRLDGAGSTLFSLTWKAKATPAGRPYCQLAASGHRTSDNDVGSWPTSMAGTPAQKGYNEAGNTDSGRKVVALASWATPNTVDAKLGNRNGDGQAQLCHQVLMAAWSTPRANKWGFPDAHGSHEQPISGPTPNGSPAQTEKPGQLDPDHSRWVMGYSAAHLSCAPTETPSFLKSRRNLSAQP